eukprot:PhM_4_TR3463/c1_g1_i12/m.25633/K01490/AMPD; AMP deaminase
MSARSRPTSPTNAMPRSRFDKSRDKKYQTDIPSNQLHHRVVVEGDDGGLDMKRCCSQFTSALLARNKYRDVAGFAQVEPLAPRTDIFQQEGIIRYTGQTTTVPSYVEYLMDMQLVRAACENATCQNACKHRLTILEEKYEMYALLNKELEDTTCRLRHSGGIYGPHYRVDTSVRLSTSMNAQALLEFILKTLETRPNDVVAMRDRNTPVTLRGLFETHNITNPAALTVEGLGLLPTQTGRFHRFDIFDKELNRGGEASAEILRTFLKANTHNNGEYFAQIAHRVLEQGASMSPKTLTELKIPVFGFNREEWFNLARWISHHRLRSDNNMWVIQIPRLVELRHADKGLYHCSTIMDQLDFIFNPLFEATLKPDDPKYKEIADLLQRVGAFNIFSDTETSVVPAPRAPYDWPWSENPPDSYFAYYVWANLASLNSLRARKGLNTFQFKPTCNVLSNTHEMLHTSFLLSDGIAHGICMADNPVIEYMYVLAQIPVSVSPLSNNGLYVPYFNNPFPRMFKCGLPVSLATDDPMHFHHSSTPLIEEYSTAQRMYRLSSADMAEVARNSVLHSSFSDFLKREALGADYAKGIEGNSFVLTCLPHMRLYFRDDCLRGEFEILKASLVASNDNKVLDSFTILFEQRAWARMHNTGKDLAKTNVTDRRIAYCRQDVYGPEKETSGFNAAAEELYKAIELRAKYLPRKTPWVEPVVFKSPQPRPGTKIDDRDHNLSFCDVNGVWIAKEPHKAPVWPKLIPTLDQYLEDYALMIRIIANPMVKALAQRRLMVLHHKFKLHLALNERAEAGSTEDKASQNRDFYQAYKVDTHVHMAAGMTAKQLLNFIVDKAKNHPDEYVIAVNGQPKTLKEILRTLDVTEDYLSIDMLAVQADATIFERFDNFNDKYNPLQSPQLREVLLKTSNYMGGRYFAELTKMTFEQFSRDKFTFAENRVSVYGRDLTEWNKLAQWFDTNGTASPHNKWLIQVPRLYELMKTRLLPRNIATDFSFGDLLQNIFEPLWEVSIFPSKNPKLHYFLMHVSGFDSVDNEALIDAVCPTLTPHEYKVDKQPPYMYWMYYMGVNIRTLNEFRSSRGLSTFEFRPHCGESGATDHLVASFLTCDQINHGINLRHSPALQYIYYLAQVGIAVSPLSNNSLFLDFLQNPFPDFFARGLNVSLSTDDPLQFHQTQEPLVEEYSIASKIWKFSANDMCELARNSVIQSGFDHRWKCSKIGDRYFLHSSAGNTSSTHLSDIRMAFRFEVYHTEMNYLDKLCPRDLKMRRAMFTIAEERDIIEKIRQMEEEREAKSSEKRQAAVASAAPSREIERLTLINESQTAKIQELSSEAEELRQRVASLKSSNQNAAAANSDGTPTAADMKSGSGGHSGATSQSGHPALPSGIPSSNLDWLTNLPGGIEDTSGTISLASVSNRNPAVPHASRMSLVHEIQNILDSNEILWARNDNMSSSNNEEPLEGMTLSPGAALESMLHLTSTDFGEEIRAPAISIPRPPASRDSARPAPKSSRSSGAPPSVPFTVHPSNSSGPEDGQTGSRMASASSRASHGVGGVTRSSSLGSASAGGHAPPPLLGGMDFLVNRGDGPRATLSLPGIPPAPVRRNRPKN